MPNDAFDFRVGSAYELPIEDDSVDLAICQCVLMHLEDPMKAVSEMKRATKKVDKLSPWSLAMRVCLSLTRLLRKWATQLTSVRDFCVGDAEKAWKKETRQRR
jgi:ubiquinone/menaquinone biosynthesis C-methylase UbiE